MAGPIFWSGYRVRDYECCNYLKCLSQADCGLFPSWVALACSEDSVVMRLGNLGSHGPQTLISLAAEKRAEDEWSMKTRLREKHNHLASCLSEAPSGFENQDGGGTCDELSCVIMS